MELECKHSSVLASRHGIMVARLHVFLFMLLLLLLSLLFALGCAAPARSCTGSVPRCPLT